ncbi:hypothetical protein P8452_33293 [Trifolium repens]|nr:hypothetical protein P8452_33293 [Trifolium repens]
MASSFFLKLTFNSLHHFAWPFLALVYPMCASVQAIETDSYEKTKHLISYWILLSLIYLFEYAFMTHLLWFQPWLYIKLMIIFWLTIPDFGRASYVYDNLIRSMKPQIDTWRKCFVEKDNFIMHAERYMKENGSEALEKLIANKNTMCWSDAEMTNEIIATDNKEVLKTNREKLQPEHKDIKDLEAIEEKEVHVTKQRTYANIVATQRMLVATLVEIHNSKLICGVCNVVLHCYRSDLGLLHKWEEAFGLIA